MPISGSATGGNDVFNGKARVFWYLVSQNFTAGTNGQSTIRWAYTVNWSPGDNCHSIRASSVNGNGAIQYSVSNTHDFVGGHVHTGDWPTVDAAGNGGFASGTYVLNHDAAGNANVQVSASHVGTSGATSTATTSVDALPQIPQTPAAASGASASRINDGQINVSWTNNSTGTAPYQNIKVYRKTDGGGWALIATLGVVTSYSDTTVSANHKYHYGINVVGANGVENFSTAEAADLWTTPGAPTSCTATKQPNNDVIVAWTNNVTYPEYLIEVQESTNGGSSWSNLNTSVASGSTSYTHVAPSTGLTHTYRVRAKTSSGTTLNSAYTAQSNTITLLSTAGAPTGLSPSGVAQDAAGNIVFTWTHNPTDGTPQNKYQLQYKVDAGAYTTVGPTTNGTSSYTLTGGTLTNGHTITWHVATAGQNGTIGAYSADSTFTTSAKPTVTINSLVGYTNSALTAGFTYFQAQSSPQATWRAYLYTAADVLLESKSGTTETSVVFATALTNATTYKVQAYVTSAAGLESAADLKTFTTVFQPPATSHISASYDAGSGSMVLTVTGDAAVPDPYLNANPYFETDVSSWTSVGSTPSIARSTLQFHQGAASGLITPDGVTATVEARAENIAVTPTTIYRARVWVRCAVSRNVSVNINWRDGALALLSTSTSVVAVTAATWTLLDFSPTSPGTVSFGQLTISMGTTPAASNTLHIDEARFSLPGSGTEPITTVDLQRKINVGQWVTIVSGLAFNGTAQAVTDYIPTINGTNTYRVIAYSAVPTSGLSAEVVNTTTNSGWGFLNTGTSFGTYAKLKARPDLQAKTSRAKAVYHFAGRTKPVQLTGQAQDLALSISGTLVNDSSTPEEFEAMAYTNGVACWRDPMGRRIFASIGDVNTNRTTRFYSDVSFGLTEVDYHE